jgi:molybdopterin-guanine dinucleotide biosynthesis protein A
MGKEKAFIEFKGKPLLIWVFDVLKDVVDELAVSVAFGRKEDYSKRLEGIDISMISIVEDSYHFFGPLGGMRSSIPHLRGELVAVAPCDSPFISRALYPLLFEKAEDFDAAVPKIRNHYEPLHAVYRKEPMVTAMELTMKRGELKPIDTYRHLRIREVGENQIMKIDPEYRSFLNMNTVEDLRTNEEPLSY